MSGTKPFPQRGCICCSPELQLVWGGQPLPADSRREGQRPLSPSWVGTGSLRRQTSLVVPCTQNRSPSGLAGTFTFLTLAQGRQPDQGWGGERSPCSGAFSESEVSNPCVPADLQPGPADARGLRLPEGLRGPAVHAGLQGPSDPRR